MFFILLDHVTGKGRQAATQERAVGVGRETDASMTKDYATTTRTDTVGQPPRARDGESSQVASNTNSQGIKARRIGRNKSCGEKAKGLQVRGFIGSRERLARALSLSLSLSPENLVPGLHREGCNAGRFVPGRPTASDGRSGLSPFSSKGILLVR
jgi:hypothetical protein